METYHLTHVPLLSVHPLHITVLGHYVDVSFAQQILVEHLALLTTNSDGVIISPGVEKMCMSLG